MPGASSSSTRVLFAASEAYPLIKTGGLGDVAGALPLALRSLGLDVRLMIPGYPAVLRSLGTPKAKQSLTILGQDVALVEGQVNGLPVLAVDAPALYDRPSGPYVDEDGIAFPDNHLRFAVYAAATAAVAQGALPGWHPDVVHAHDWQAGLAPAYVHHSTGPKVPTLLTIHNLSYAGSFPASVFPELGLPDTAFATEGVEFHGQVSFLKAGLHYATHLSTVSPTYAVEIQTPTFGSGFDGLLRHRVRDLTGILNGIDAALWNPATDDALASTYGPGDLKGKSACRRALQKDLRLDPDSKATLYGMVSRLTHQKGVDLLLDVLPALLASGAQVVVVGTGDRALEDRLARAAVKNPGRMAVRLAYSETLAHQVFGGCDAFLMPSRFEPCGLTQMQALRYGTLPVVRRTGGLADTVRDADTPDGNGFVFEEATPQALDAALIRVHHTRQDRRRWRAMMQRGLAEDFGWPKAAAQYGALYQALHSA